MDFVALDFETANADLSSVCQVGLVAFKNGEVTDTFSTLIDPDDYFDPINVHIHGIDSNAVSGAPRFAAIYPELCRRTSETIVVCHSLFDRAAFERASIKSKLEPVTCRWLDTMRVVRRAWRQYAHEGYGLANLAQEFGITFDHHDAAEDARTTGLILVRALRETGLSLDDWLVRAARPLSPEPGRITRDGNPDGPLAGEIVVFTGALSIPRHDAADMASEAGCEVDASVTKKTTLLVVGDQDVTRLAPGEVKSAKHIRAEELIAKGQSIRILRETDFRQIVSDGVGG